MYGKRARIGVIIPSTNTVVESEFWKMAPEGVSIHASRMKLTKTTPETLKQMITQMERAADELATAQVNIIIFACTSGSFVGGIEWENKLTKKIMSLTSIKAITTSGAVVGALREMKSKKIVMATPYIPELNELEKSFFELKGFKILNSKCLGLCENTKIGSLSPEVAYKLAKEVYLPESDAIFISCTDFRTIEIIEKLETDLDIPVITSNQASIWAALRGCGIKDSIKGYGKLLSVR